MLQLHNGSALRHATETILENMTDGPVTFIATSVEGVAVAAACAALCDDGSDWERVPLVGPRRPTRYRPIVVEPVDGGLGWRNTMQRRYPEAVFVMAADAALAAF
jgi:hypothetical protein